MGILEIIRIALLDLALHWFRSFLAALGIIFAVASVVAMMAISEGAKQSQLAGYAAMGVDNIIVKTVRPTAPKGGALSRFGLRHRDLLHVQNTFTGIRHAVGLRNMRKKLFTRAGKKLDLTVLATRPEFLQLFRGTVERGRFLTDMDEKDFKRVCVVGAGAARELFSYHDPLQFGVRIGTQWFKCVGILRQSVASKGGWGFDADKSVFITLNTARVLFDSTPADPTPRSGRRGRRAGGGTPKPSIYKSPIELDTIALQVTNEAYVLPTAARLRNYLRKAHGMKDFQVYVPLAEMRQKAATQRTWSIVMGAIAAVSLVVGGIGIMNIMLANVSDRRKEIGTRRALGARRKDILQQFVIEAATLTGLGGVIGACLGFAAAMTISRLTDLQTDVSRFWVVLSVSASCLTGILFGFWPAYQAARVKPIEALRSE